MDQKPEIPAALRALMAELGPKWLTNTGGHIAQMTDAFSAVHAATTRDPVRETHDIAYGAHPRQQLDVYLPAEPGAARATVLFVHGGGFTEGQRNRSPEIYGNVCRYFARNGINALNVGYRLAPEATWPAGSLDLGTALDWARAHAGAHEIDPDRLFLMGHSAGGAHVASYAYDRRCHPAEGPGVAGVMIISGRVRADNLPENTNARRVESYYGVISGAAADDLFDDVSGLSHVGPDAPPSFIAWTEYENALLDVYALELAWRLGQVRRRAPPICYLPGHNHASIIGHIGTTEDVLGAALRDFVARPR